MKIVRMIAPLLQLHELTEIAVMKEANLKFLIRAGHSAMFQGNSLQLLSGDGPFPLTDPLGYAH